MRKRLHWLLAWVVAAFFLFGSVACLNENRTSKSGRVHVLEENEAWVADGELHFVCTSVTDDYLGAKLEYLISIAMDDGVQKFVLHLNNGGGSALIMFDIINTLERFQARGLHITTIAQGYIASAAVPLFLVGDERVIYKDTMVMLHPCGGWNNPVLEACDMPLVVEISERYCKYVAKKTKWTYEQIKERMMPAVPEHNSRTFCLWFNSEQALMWGFATKIE